MRIFLDANILFSAAKAPGAVRRFLGLLNDAGHVLVADPYVIGEAERNIRSKQSEAQPELNGILEKVELQPCATKRALQAVESIPLDPKDRPVLASAISGRCDLLVTGDASHFGDLYGRAVQGVTVLSPRQAAERLGLGERLDSGHSQ